MCQSQFIEMFGDTFKNNKNWPFKKLPEVTTIVLGSTPSSSNSAYWDGDIKWITPAEIEEDSFYLYDSARHLTEDGVQAASLKSFPTGTVILSTRAPIGKTAIAGCEMYCNQGFKNFVCKKDLNSVYLYYTLKSHKEELQKMGTGSTFLELSKKAIEQIAVSIPPRAKQDEFETIYQQADKSKFSGPKSQFIEMFGKRSTTPVGNYIKDSFPGEWGKEDKEGNGVKVIRTTNFTNSGKLNLSEVVSRSIEERKVQKKQIQKYDTILERSGGTADNPVGRVVLFEEDEQYLCNNFTQVLRFKDIEPRFTFYALFYFYQTNKTAIRSMGSKTTGIQNLNMSKYLEIGIPNANEFEQKQFVSIAEQADKSKQVAYSLAS